MNLVGSCCLFIFICVTYTLSTHTLEPNVCSTVRGCMEWCWWWWCGWTLISMWWLTTKLTTTDDNKCAVVGCILSACEIVIRSRPITSRYCTSGRMKVPAEKVRGWAGWMELPPTVSVCIVFFLLSPWSSVRSTAAVCRHAIRRERQPCECRYRMSVSFTNESFPVDSVRPTVCKFHQLRRRCRSVEECLPTESTSDISCAIRHMINGLRRSLRRSIDAVWWDETKVICHVRKLCTHTHAYTK